MTFMTLYSFVQAWASVGNPRSMGNPRGQHIWVDEIKRSRGVGVGVQCLTCPKERVW